MSGFGRDKSRRVDFNGFQGSPMSGFGRGNRAFPQPHEAGWILRIPHGRLWARREPGQDFGAAHGVPSAVWTVSRSSGTRSTLPKAARVSPVGF